MGAPPETPVPALHALAGTTSAAGLADEKLFLVAFGLEDAALEKDEAEDDEDNEEEQI